MPTIAELKDALKAKGIKGYSGKNKAELEAMLAGGKKEAAPAAEAPKPKAVEAAPAPLSAHAESMAKKAKPAKTGAISTPLSALSAGPAKRSLAEERAELEAKIKKYEDKKKKAEERIKEIDESIKAEKPAPASAPATGSSKKIPSELADKMRKDPFLMKAYDNSVDSLIEEIEKVMNGEGDFKQSITREYSADKAYELGDFYSMKWPRNANDVSIPKATDKLISQIPGHKYELKIYDTGDSEAYGRYNAVVMVLLESK